MSIHSYHETGVFGSAMDQNSVEDEVVKHFKEGNVSTIVLSGKSGTGKTWIARKVGLRAVKEKVVDFTLWICLSVKHDGRSLFELVAHQLSLFSPSVEMQSDGTEEVDGMVGKEETLEVLKEKVRVRLSADGVLREILVILDDEGSKINEGDPNLEQLLQFVQQNSYKPSSTVANGSGQGQEKVKVLITSHNEGDRHKTEGHKKVIDMMPLTPAMSISLLRQKAGVKASESSDVKTLIENFIERKTSFTPGEVNLLAKLLSFHQLEYGLQDLENDLEEASRGDIYNYTHLLFRGCEKIPDGVSVDFSWQGSHLFRDIGSVHYGELISYWIMEGYLGPINGLEKAYEEGHKILMQLMDCQMLKKVNDDFLHMASAIVDFADHHHDGYGGTANLGLAYVLADICAWDGFGKVTKMDGRIGTLGIYRKGHQLTTLLLDGNCLSGEDPNHLIQTNQELQNLGLFSLRFVSLPRSLSDLSKLTVLVLRSCDFLESIDDIKKLGTLTVLEVSGSCLVKSIPRDFFDQLTKLRSLHFSDLQIEELPPSFYDLTELRWLILKGCSHLTQLQSLRKSEKLMVVDLSGAYSLTNFSEKNLKSLPKLEILNLSRTNVKVLPIFRETGELTHLSLSGCGNMDRLPSIRTLTNLQVLDISGSTIREFHDKSFQSNSSLKILDLSETMIPSDLIPATISKAREFYLRNCYGVKYVKCEFAKDLEVLDFSGSYNLVKVYEKSFARLENLRVLNMSKTKVEDLPSLSALHNLRLLLLSSCLNLKKLPNLASSKLEELDLSDCNALTFIENTSFEHLPCLRRLILSKTNIERLPELSSLTNLEELNLRGVKSVTKADFLERMSKLKYLDLSETALEQLLTLSNLKDLNHLFLRGCRQLETLQPLEELQKLEILDLSQTAIHHLPSLGNFSNLRSLLLGDCPNLENFKNIKVLDLSGDIIKNLPYENSRLTQLEHFAFPSMMTILAVDSNDMSSSQEKLDTIDWYISSFAVMAPNTDRSFMSVSSSGFLELRQSSPSIWDPTLNHFHLSVHPIKLQKGTGVFFFHKDEFIFRDIYLLSRHYESKEPGRLLEVHHLRTFPTGIEDVLSHAEYIFLFDNLFIKSLADLGADSIKKLKGCWMEGCQNMEVVIEGNDAGHTTELGLTLEILWISNASSLRSIYDKDLHSGGFQHLKCLHLDCCPMLSGILFSSHSLQKLEILQVRFCENLETLFENDNEEHKVPNLRTLRLWELPKLKGIGCPMPSLQFLEVGECPLLRHVLSASHVPDKLEVLKVRNCVNLDNLLEGFTSENCKLSHLGEVRLWGLPKLANIGIEAPLLRTLEVGDCPLLTHVISTQMPEDLKVLKVRFCDNLDTLFDGIIPENRILPRLDIVQLWHLPKLTSIGITLPAGENVIVRECPELPTPVS